MTAKSNLFIEAFCERRQRSGFGANFRYVILLVVREMIRRLGDPQALLILKLAAPRCGWHAANVTLMHSQEITA